MGDALSALISYEITVSSPSDPLHYARISAIEENGGNGFMDYFIAVGGIEI